MHGSVPENDLPDLSERDLDIPDDPILDFVNSQYLSSEDLEQALQPYQAYQESSPQDSTMTLERSINHHFTHRIAQASQAKHADAYPMKSGKQLGNTLLPLYRV